MVRCHTTGSPVRSLISSFRLCTKGCVRFWDVRRSSDDISNGEVLARPISVGEPYNGDKPLVVWVYYRVDNVLKLTSFL